ncbi:hypothetical protein M409DRAFT_69964 [Zasmidium cellare ATCC 36951]|uniref:Cytochrome P450 n=1 Tax=Zasmidium cellare ATCC 36951 TaxID=1080233 RepID=A0A6A6C4K1_ZASCE|nr:uncharacterized protein M409DRAFT_69964 [Zasmidium cellare ATCC 36951]KAF2161110.1 hypothetical protein M409DRAFT_69964 [Zasmidium cellare ATCC 36951]
MLFPSDVPVWLLILATCLLLAPIALSLTRTLTSPLNAIPGPWPNRLSPIPYFYNSAFLLRQAQYLTSLHLTHGPIVRLGPNEIGLSSLEDIKAVHKIGAGFAKAPWYDYIAMTEADRGPPGLFQMRDFHEHAGRRKLLARGFAVSGLRGAWEGMVREKARKAVEGIGRDAVDGRGRVVDVRRWWMIMASDVISEVAFGKSFGGLETGENSTFSDAILRSNKINMLALMLPWVYNLATHIPIPAWTPYFKAHVELADIASVAVRNSRADATDRNIFSSILSQGEKANDEGTLTDQQILIEAGNLISAGSDTTAETLTYLVWAVLSHPETQKLLEEEVALVEEPMRDSELEKLPVLNAVIQETLRLYPASPFPEPRVVPKGGATFQGYFLPEGTVVSTSPWVTQRNAEFFPDPERFDYTRWLPNGPATNSETSKAAWWPFGAGSRVCIGRHLAMMEIRMAATLFFREYRGAKLAPETTEESMAVNNFVISHPAGGACWVVLPERKA